MTRERGEAEKRQIRLAAGTIIVAFVTWVGANLLGREMDLPVRYAFLVDMLCLAALAWALWVLFGVWRRGAGKG